MIQAWVLRNIEDPEKFLQELAQPLPNRTPTPDASEASLQQFESFLSGR